MRNSNKFGLFVIAVVLNLVLNFFLPLTEASAATTIQGVKIDDAGGFTNPGATITVSGPSFSDSYGPSVNPYVASQIPNGTYTVTSSVPDGYTVSYSLCRNCVDHVPSSYVAGNSIVIDSLSEGYADLWWKYTPAMALTSIQGVKISNNAGFTNPGAAITVSGPAFTNSYGPSVNPYVASQIPGGTYTVTTSVPDGYTASYSLCRNCVDHPASGYVAGNFVTINFLSGGYADLWWNYTPVPVNLCDTSFKDNQFNVCFFEGTGAPTGAVNALSQYLEMTVPSPVGAFSGFNRDWSAGPVGNTGVVDNISGVWRGKINFDAGAYVFHTVSDDGIELNIAGFGNVISNWTDHAPTQNDSASIEIPAGPREVQLRWYENGGGAVARLWWDFISAVPGTGNIVFKAAVNGMPSPAVFNASHTYPGGATVAQLNLPVEGITQQGTTGQHTVGFASGAPAGTIFQSITPSRSQMLVNAGTIPFTFNFVSPHTNQTALWNRGEVLLKNFLSMYNGQVNIEPGDPYPYKMWFFGWAVEVCNRHYTNQGCDAIFYARSTNSINWEVYSGKDPSGNNQFDATMNPGLWRAVFLPQNTYYDQWHNGDPSVVKINGVYYMAYSSSGFDLDGIPNTRPGDSDKDSACIMGAVSTDGINWERSFAPILIASNEAGNSQDPVNYGNYHRPSILYEDGKFKMWFDYWHPTSGLSMGYAELAGAPSPSVFLSSPWTIIQAGDNPALANFPNPDVVKVGNQYFAYADPPITAPAPGDTTGWTSRKVTEAISLDGRFWRVTGYVDPEAGCAADHVPEAYVENGKINITYGCQKGGNPYDFTYFEIRRMSKPIPAANNAQFVSQSVPSTMTSGQQYPVGVTFKNTGTNHWDLIGPQGNTYRLGSQNPGDNSTWGKSRIELPKTVAADGTVTLNFNVTAPSAPGSYNFQWRMLKEGVEWFGDQTPDVVVSVQGGQSLQVQSSLSTESLSLSAAAQNNAKFISQSVPATMYRGLQYLVVVTMKNTGRTTWDKLGIDDNVYRLKSQNPAGNSTWGIVKVPLPKTVIADGQVTFIFAVRAPGLPGNYKFQWRMFNKGSGDFGEFTPVVTVQVR